MKVYKEYVLKNGKKLIIRSAEKQDAKEELEMYKKKTTETPFLSRGEDDVFPSVEDFEECSQDYLENEKACTLVAVLDGKIIGTGHLDWYGSRKRYCHRGSVDLGVLKDYWGLGVGGKIMQTLLDHAKNVELEQVELCVVRENERAIKMYESFGFIVTGVEPRVVKYSDGTYADELSMVKFLKEADKYYGIDYER